jgi:acyl-CoA reductase-like NAD-dependent aldehyde dehydrogenase
VKRILVMQKVADEFVALVLDKAKRIKFGNPMLPATDLGTVINEQAAITFERLTLDAAERGAKILYNPGRQGAVLPPITLDFVPHSCLLVAEETFGPVIPILRVAGDDDQVIKTSNSTAFGLSSGVCTNRLDRVTRYVEGLNVGTVNIWEVPGYRIEMSPFGGIKDSGNGVKEGVLEAMKFFTNVKTYSLPWPV